MGRLFWKIFLSIWLAQTIAVLAVSGSIWIKDRNQARRTESLDMSPPATFELDAATATLTYGGIDALRALLRQRERRQVYAIDRLDHEILDRPVAAAIRDQVKRLAEQPGDRPVVREVTLASGQTYLLFVPRAERREFGPPGRMGERPPRMEPGHHGPGGVHFPLQPMLLTVLASLVSAALLAWHFSKPIRNLRFAFAAASMGDLNRKIGPAMGRRRDELADLGREFDRMADRLSALMDGQRRLLHDVSHELRSPLARLHAAIGLARQKPEKIDASLARIERESDRMESLVAELLTLSRLEAGVMSGLDEEINVGELLADVIDDARFEAEPQRKKLIVEEKPVPPIKGHPELLHRAFENVIRNAIKHTVEDSAITISIDKDMPRQIIRVTISDQGPGVPEDELDRIFEPFFRSSKTEKQVNGHGLGLAIAKRTIEAHRGIIHASNNLKGGLSVAICLPVDNSFERNARSGLRAEN